MKDKKLSKRKYKIRSKKQKHSRKRTQKKNKRSLKRKNTNRRTRRRNTRRNIHGGKNPFLKRLRKKAEKAAELKKRREKRRQMREESRWDPLATPPELGESVASLILEEKEKEKKRMDKPQDALVEEMDIISDIDPNDIPEESDLSGSSGSSDVIDNQIPLSPAEEQAQQRLNNNLPHWERNSNSQNHLNPPRTYLRRNVGMPNEQEYHPWVGSWVPTKGRTTY
jgi:hypothetical protein